MTSGQVDMEPNGSPDIAYCPDAVDAELQACAQWAKEPALCRILMMYHCVAVREVTKIVMHEDS
jgi:hypothetical protein